MPQNYAQLDALSADPTFLGRTRQSLRFIASYFLANPTAATQAQLNWSTAVVANQRVTAIANQLVSELLTNPNIVASSNPIDSTIFLDADFKAAVQAICFKYAP